MTFTPIRCLTTLVCSALGSLLLLAPASAQIRTPSTAPLGPGLACTVFGPDRVCASDGSVDYLAQVSPNLPGSTYAWSLHLTTTDGCPGTGTTTPSFCGPTNLPTVCINPGLSPGRFVVKVVITNGPATSSCCLSVNVRPTTFTSTPPPASVCEGATHTFCTTASGGGPYTYSWTKNGAVIPGATNSCYTATAGLAGVIDNYCVTTTGSGMCAVSYTACALLTALPKTSVAALPSPRRCEGQTFQFCATVGGTGPFTYSWTKNGVAIPGATDVCYTATAAAPATVDTYCISVAGACGPPVVRCGTLTARLSTVTSSLTGANLCQGLTHQFCTTAGGTGPFTYSWTKNAAAIPGATDSCYTATAGTGGTIDTYCVRVVGTCGEASSCAELSSFANTSTSTIGDDSLCAGTTAQYCITPGGQGPFTYSWTKNGVGIPGATDICYTATAGASGTIDTYCASAQGFCGPPSSSCFELTATAGTTLVSLTPPVSGCPGSAQQLCVSASGTGPFTYAWSKNTVLIPGATDSCYTATAGAAGTVDTYCVNVVGTCGSITPCTTVTALPGTTTTEVEGATVCEGLTHQFCTTAGGTGPFTYSWTKNAVAIPGATDNCYTATAGVGGTIDTYCVNVAGACGSVQRCATLTATTNATATDVPSATVCEGLTHQFCTTAGGTGPFTYSWTKNAVAIPGATDNCYTATAGAGGTVDTYCVNVAGTCGTVQRCATLTATTGATATDLQSATVCEGLTQPFCTTAGGNGPFTYSWTMNGAAIPGATDSCYTATAGVGGTVDTYCVTVSGSCGSPVQRCSTLTSTSGVTATPLTSASACDGFTHQFCTTAGGTGPFTYSWTKNGSPIAGATASCYTATAASGGAVDTYCVSVAGACGSVQHCATLTADSSVSATPMAPRAICTGSTFQFCTTAGGTGPFTYSWTKNGSTIAGATTSCYTATAGPPPTSDLYCVTVTGACGSATQCVRLRAQGNTTATPMADANVCPGGSHTFCTAVGGVGPWTFSWTRNGVLVPGATTNCYTATTGPIETEVICVTVTGQCGPPVTRCATMYRRTLVKVVPIGSAFMCEGTTHTFCAVAHGDGPFAWAWEKNGVAIPGATNSCYTATAPASGGPPDTYCVTLTGPCNFDVSCGTLTGVSCLGAFVTLDPSDFGDQAGQFNGAGMQQLVSGLLTTDLPLGRIGMNSLTVPGNPGAASCVMDLLATTGTLGILPAFGDEALDPNQCQSFPVPIPLVNGEFESLLIGQLVTTSLNVKLNEVGVAGCTTTQANLAGMGLCSTMVSRTLLPGPDGCMGTPDDVPDILGPDGNSNTPDNLVTVTIPAGVISALNELTHGGHITKGQTVGGLVELAHLAVSGGNTWTATRQDISAALDAVTILYHRGRETVDCRNP